MEAREETCGICGCATELQAIEQHHIVPTEVTKQAGMPESATVRLCRNCHREVHTWYSMKVTDIAYDLEAKRFKTKSWRERVKDYEPVFNAFVKYKEQQKQIGQGST